MSLARSEAVQIGVKPLVARMVFSLRIPQTILTRIAPTLAFLALIALWLAAYLERGLKLTVAFPGFEGDGPFQTFNPLRRIAAGQSGGVDFQYFHGIGFPYLHYPIFVLAGGDVFATELSRHLVNLIVFFASTLAICAALGKRWVPTLGLTAFALILTEQAPLFYLTTVGNASSGVRSAAPFFAVAVLLAGLRPRREAIGVGFATGLGLLTGVEHGLATIPMLIVVWIGRRIIGHPGGAVSWALTVAATIIVSAGGALIAIGGPSGAVAALKYSLLEVPADQFWYFGAPPNSFLFQWSVLLSDRRLFVFAVVPLLVVAAVAAHFARRYPEERPTAVILFGLVAYGFLSMAAYLGYTSGHYLEPATRAAVTVGFVLAWRGWLNLQARGVEGESARRSVRIVLASILGASLLVGPTAFSHCSILHIPETARGIANNVVSIREGRCKMLDDVQKELDAMVGAIDADRAANGVLRPPVIWSTYAGRLEAHYGVFNPACDYTIHAIGPRHRTQYVEIFREKQPDYVVTCRESQYQYEEWLRNATWEFYEEILLNYRPMFSEKRFVIWHRNGQPWRSPDPSAGRIEHEPEAADWFAIPAPPGVPESAPRIVEVEYRIDNPLAGVPVIGGLPRYLLGPARCENSTQVSLPPYRTTWSFPVFPSPGEVPLFSAKTYSLVGGKVAILRIRVRPMPATPEQLAALRK